MRDSDVKAYRDFVAASRGRVDLGAEEIARLLARCEERAKDPAFKHKREHYRREAVRLKAVLRVIEA